MFKRFSIHIAFIFVFVFTQMGAVTHEISHIEDHAKHSHQDSNQQDKSTHNNQCAQCISYADVASGLQAKPSVFHLVAAKFVNTSFHHKSYLSHNHAAYTARAPPRLN